MALHVSEANAKLDAIAARIANDRAKLVKAKADVTAADDDLGSISTAYSQFISDINDAVTNNPSNAYYLALKARKDLLVTEFQALKTVSASMKSNLSGNDPS